MVVIGSLSMVGDGGGCGEGVGRALGGCWEGVGRPGVNILVGVTGKG